MSNLAFENYATAPDHAAGLLGWAERGLLPDPLIRMGVRHLCARRLRVERAGGPAAESQRMAALIDELRRSPLALHVDVANRQHYELPAAFFGHCLGHRLKYSSAYYPTGRESLDEAEDAMLSLYGERAQLDGARHILELGCGWGSLTLWMAERHPAARITAVSNSRGQRDHILARCKERGLRNVEVITGDVNHLDLEAGVFDRCVSVELLEHVRNYQRLLQRIASWLTADGKLFIHIFVHRTLTYPFETAADDDWMGRNFFTGGLMPAADTLLHFQDDVTLRRRWLLSGRHYQRTADHWLQNQDRNCRDVMAVLCQHYGEPAAALWFQRWRMFWMACAELFGYRGGSEWMVAHYLFEPRARGAGR